MNNEYEYEYEILDLEDDYIKEITGKNTINIDINEYKNIIKNLINKTSKLENDNKKKDMDFLELNSKYFNVLDDFNNLNRNYCQLDNDLHDMETVNIKLLDIIKNKD
jgi:hypothetical protein